MINQHFNKIGSFVFPTQDKPDTIYNRLNKAQPNPSFLLKQLGYVDPYRTKKFMDEQPNIRQILSLPDNLYKQVKDSWVVLLKENHQKLTLDRELFNFIMFPPARMRNFEQALFGKTLIPRERLSRYKINIKSQQDVGAIQQVRAGVQSGVAEDSTNRLFASGQLMLLVLNVLMSLSQQSKAALEYNVSGLKMLANSDGKLQREISHVQIVLTWLSGSATAKQPDPYIENLTYDPDLGGGAKKMAQSAVDVVCESGRINTACDDTNFKYKGQGFFQGISKWLKDVDNRVSADKSKAQTNIQTKMSDNQSANSSIQKLLNIIEDARSSLASLGK